MATYDPRIISNAIETLDAELQRFTDTNTETSRQAASIQSSYRERVDRVSRWSAILLDRALNDTVEVRDTNDKIDRLLIQCESAIETAHQTLTNSNNVRDISIATQARWTQELQIALSWETTATQELDRAKAAEGEARSFVSIAHNRLSSATSSLNSCQSDTSKKRNCTSQSIAVSMAKDELNAAKAELDRATARVNFAEQELLAAKARVQQCRTSLKIAEQAVMQSYQAIQIATESLVRAESSLSDAHAAQTTAIEAQQRAIEAEEFARETVTRSRQAEGIIDVAQIQLYQATKASDSAHNLAIRAKLDLNYRNEQLREFNRVSSSI